MARISNSDQIADSDLSSITNRALFFFFNLHLAAAKNARVLSRSAHKLFRAQICRSTQNATCITNRNFWKLNHCREVYKVTPSIQCIVYIDDPLYTARDLLRSFGSACGVRCPNKTKFWKLIWEQFFWDVTSCPKYENRKIFFLKLGGSKKTRYVMCEQHPLVL